VLSDFRDRQSHKDTADWDAPLCGQNLLKPKPNKYDKYMKKHLTTTMLIGAVSALSSLATAQQLPDAFDAPSTRLEARLQPVIAVDASGQARLDNEVNVANDRFIVEVEIAKADFADLGITPGNGFRDEVVVLQVLRGGVAVFNHRLQFSRNLPNDITFETDIRGTGAPELHAGDTARVIVNNHFTLRGRFQAR